MSESTKIVKEIELHSLVIHIVCRTKVFACFVSQNIKKEKKHPFIDLFFSIQYNTCG